MTRDIKNSDDVYFCHTCSEFTIKSQRNAIISLVKNASMLRWIFYRRTNKNLKKVIDQTFSTSRVKPQNQQFDTKV